MIKIVFFDFDGVIANTYRLVYRLCNQMGFRVTHKLLKEHHDGNVYEKPKIPFDKGYLKEYIKVYNGNIRKKNLFPVKEEIEKLSKTHKLYVVSSNNEKGIKKLLRLGKLEKYFDGVLGMETNRSKVKKFNSIIKKEKVKKNECVFVADTLGDMREGKKAKIKTVGVTWGFHRKKRLLLAKPSKIISHISQIEKTIDTL